MFNFVKFNFRKLKSSKKGALAKFKASDLLIHMLLIDPTQQNIHT